MAQILPSVKTFSRPARANFAGNFFGRSSASKFGFSSGPSGMPSSMASRVRPAPSPLIGSIQNISQSVYGGEEQASPSVVNRLVTQKINNLIPNITNRVEQTVNTFDPSALLGKLFSGGLGPLQSFADGLAQLTQPLKQLLDFATQSAQIFAKLIKQLADSGQPASTGRGRGLLNGMKNLLKGGTLALGAASTGMAVDTVMRAQREPVVTDTGGAPPPAPQSSVLPAQEGSTKDLMPGTLNIDEIKAFNDAIFKFDRLLSAMLRQQDAPETSGGSTSTPQSSAMEPVDPGDPPGNVMSGSGPGAGTMSKAGAFTIPDTVALLKSVGATDAEAVALATRSKYESSGNPMAHNDSYLRGGSDNSYGLFQVNMIDRPGYKLGEDRRNRYKIKNEDLFDPVTNARIALDILRSGGKAGLSAWTTGGSVTKTDIKEAEASLSTWKETAATLGAKSVAAHGEKPPTIQTPAPSTAQPAPAEAQQRQEASQTISTDASSAATSEDATEGDVNTTILPISMGGQQQAPVKLNPPDSRSSVTIPFLPAMKDDVHMMYSRIVYNVVDA